MRCWTLRFAALALLVCSATFADYQSGLDAYNEGKYRTALKQWRAVVDEPPNEETRPYYAESLYAIAMLYWQGQGVRQNYKKSRDWLNRAAARSHAGAQAKLAYLYTDGVGVAQDYDKAFLLYTQAAQQGDVDGQYNLGIFYYYGWGTEVDKTMAAQYLAAASAQGDLAAEEALLRVMAEINVAHSDEAANEPAPEPSTSGLTTSELTTSEPSTADQPAFEPAPAALATEAMLKPMEWIDAQDPDHYTIQVIALSSRPRLEALVEGFEDHRPFAMYTVTRNGRPLYVLLQGIYTDVEAARRARDYFPKQIQRTDKLWIRQFGMVQDQLAGESQ